MFTFAKSLNICMSKKKRKCQVFAVQHNDYLHTDLTIIDDFGVSDAIDEISLRGCRLDFGPA